MKAAPEPATFHANVRKRGRAWLAANKISITKKLAQGTTLEPYWRDCLDDLHKAYAGVCAYGCVFVERVTGGISTDHFIAKSRKVGLAYEWSNYRLACTSMNGRKSDFDTVLDPIGLARDTFRLELVTGRIYPRLTLPTRAQRHAQDTIDLLGLDDKSWREIRARHYEEYCNEEYDERFLRKRSPFVWYEAKRQKLL